MILMPVGDKKSFHPVDILLQVRDIRHAKIDPVHIILRERQSAVHNNNTVSAFKGSNIIPMDSSPPRGMMRSFELFFFNK